MRPTLLPLSAAPRLVHSSPAQLVLRAATCVGVMSLALGCSDSGPDSGDSGELLAPPPEGKGMQLEMRTEIESGAEVEHCKFIQMPASGLNINRTETRFTEGSHHVLLSRALLREVFQYPHGKGHGGALIQHVPAHHDHLHVRFRCPPADPKCE